MGGREPVIAIDGPAGAGKGTVARRLAARLGYRLLDTGSMYRALAWSVARAGLQPDDTPALRRHVERVQIDLEGDRVVVDGRDVTDDIRTQEIANLTSRLSMLAIVRDKLTPLQRRLASTGGVVLEGREVRGGERPHQDALRVCDLRFDWRLHGGGRSACGHMLQFLPERCDRRLLAGRL